MAKLPGLYRRKDGGTFQLRVMVPQDLRELYGKTQLVESLGTADSASANRIGAARRALKLTEFDERRKISNPQRLDSISPELGKLLAERVASKVLGTDELVRSDAEKARLLLAADRPFGASKLRIGSPLVDTAPAEADAFGDLGDDLADELAGVNSASDALAARQMPVASAAGVHGENSRGCPTSASW